MRDTEREAETQAEGEAGCLQGSRCGTRSQDPRITTWAKGRCLTTEPPRHPEANLCSFRGFEAKSPIWKSETKSLIRFFYKRTGNRIRFVNSVFSLHWFSLPHPGLETGLEIRGLETPALLSALGKSDVAQTVESLGLTLTNCLTLGWWHNLPFWDFIVKICEMGVSIMHALAHFNGCWEMTFDNVVIILCK